MQYQVKLVNFGKKPDRELTHDVTFNTIDMYFQSGANIFPFEEICSVNPQKMK